jgi:hypothetical protein
VERALALALRHHHLVVLGVDRARDPPCERRLVVATVREAQAEGGEGPSPGARGEDGDEPRVDAAGEEHTERHLGGHAQRDRAHERLAGAGDAAIGVGCGTHAGAVPAHQRVPRPPVATRSLGAVPVHEHRGGRELAERGVGAVLAGEATVHEVARERRGGGLARDPGQRQQRRRLRGERESTPGRRQEQRLLSGAVARQRQRACGAIPERHREHAVQGLGEVLAPVLVEVGQERRIGSGREVVAVREQLALEGAVVVELAVRHAHHVAGLVLQHARGLARGDDRQTRDPQGAVAAVPERLARGAAMAQARHHAAHQLQALGAAQVRGHQSGDAAHRLGNLLVAPGVSEVRCARR